MIPEKLTCFESEQQVIGIAISFDEWERIELSGLAAQHFLSAPHRMIFNACKTLHAKRQGVDVYTVQHALSESDTLDMAGGFQYLIELAKNARPSNLDTHIEIVKLKHQSREAYALMSSAVEEAKTGDLNVNDLISSLMNRMSTASTAEHDANSVANAAIDELEKSIKGHFPGVKYGFKALDDATGGAHNSDLVVIAAKPAMGKTALMLNMITNSIEAGVPVGFVSAEMPVGQIGMRIGCSVGRVSASKARKGDLDDTDWNNYARGLSLLNSVAFHVLDRSAPKIGEVEAMIRKWKHRSGIKAAYIDYIQRIGGSNPKSERWAQVAEVTQRLKTLARELDIPIICLAQVNRDVDANKNKRPELGSIANSSEIEKEADQIMTLYRDEVYHEDTPDRGIAEVDFKKNRHGPTGCIRLAWVAQYMRFSDLGRSEDGI